MTNMRYAVGRSVAGDYDGLHGVPQVKRFWDTTRHCYRTALLIDVGRRPPASRLPEFSEPNLVFHKYKLRENQTAALAIEYVKAHPGATRVEIAEAIGRHKTTVYTSLLFARREGAVRVEGKNPMRYFIKEDA